MWDIPGPGIKLVSPALADRLLTTGPPESGNSCQNLWKGGKATGKEARGESRGEVGGGICEMGWEPLRPMTGGPAPGAGSHCTAPSLGGLGGQDPGGPCVLTNTQRSISLSLKGLRALSSRPRWWCLNSFRVRPTHHLWQNHHLTMDRVSNSSGSLQISPPSDDYGLRSFHSQTHPKGTHRTRHQRGFYRVILQNQTCRAPHSR